MCVFQTVARFPVSQSQIEIITKLFIQSEGSGSYYLDHRHTESHWVTLPVVGVQRGGLYGGVIAPVSVAPDPVQSQTGGCFDRVKSVTLQDCVRWFPVTLLPFKNSIVEILWKLNGLCDVKLRWKTHRHWSKTSSPSSTSRLSRSFAATENTMRIRSGRNFICSY